MAVKTSFNLKSIDRMQPGETLRDPETPGLLVEANRNGSRSWRYLRKVPGTAKQVRKTLGVVSDFSLIEAQDWARALNRPIALGLDPAVEEAKEAAVAEAEAERLAMTVRAAWELQLAWMNARMEAGEIAKQTVAMKASRMRKDILPAVGDKPLSSVTHDDLWAIIERKADAGLASASNHLVGDIRAFFRWCMTHGRTKTGLRHNPATDLIKLHGEKERTRCFDLWEIKAFLAALAEDSDVMTQRVMRLLVCSGQRLDNVLRARKSDWQEGAWIIPDRDSKTDIPYVVPLGAWGAGLFAGEGEWVFPSVRGDGPRLGHTRAIIDRLTERMQKFAPKGKRVEKWTSHDFRRVVRTHMERLKINERVCEAILGHKDSGIRKHYMMYRYLDEKRDALKAWEGELARLANEMGVAGKLGLQDSSPKLAGNLSGVQVSFNILGAKAWQPTNIKFGNEGRFALPLTIQGATGHVEASGNLADRQ